MKTTRCSHSNVRGQAEIQVLEDRRLLSGTLPLSGEGTLLISPGVTVPVLPTTKILTPMPVHAVAGEPFKAVVGTALLPSVLPGFSLSALINWGDGSGSSLGTLVTGPAGLISIEGSHNYAAAGTDPITVTITRNPPSGSAALIIVVGTIKTNAFVVADDGGVTLNEFPGDAFTATLGTFSSNLSLSTMTATISWGDGSVSTGKIIALPTTGASAGAAGGGMFAVQGTHSYTTDGSYPVHISVTSRPVPVTTSPTPPVLVNVAQIDSAIDVLPVSPVAVGVATS